MNTFSRFVASAAVPSVWCIDSSHLLRQETEGKSLNGRNVASSSQPRHGVIGAAILEAAGESTATWPPLQREDQTRPVARAARTPQGEDAWQHVSASNSTFGARAVNYKQNVSSGAELQRATTTTPTYFKWRFVWSSKLTPFVSFTLPGFTTQREIELDGETVTAPPVVNANGKYWQASDYDDAVKICERAFNCEYIAEYDCANHFRQNYGGANAKAGDDARILTPQNVRDTWVTADTDVIVRLGDHEQASKLDATPQTNDGSCYLQKQSISRPIVLADGIASDTELLNVTALTNLGTLTSVGQCTQVTHLAAALDVAEFDAERSVIYSPESCDDSGLGLEAAFDATQGAIVGLTKKDYDATGWYVCMDSVSRSLDRGGAGACVLLINPSPTTTTTTPGEGDDSTMISVGIGVVVSLIVVGAALAVSSSGREGSTDAARDAY